MSMKDLAREYLEYLQTTGLRRLTQDGYRYAIAHFFDWLTERGLSFAEVGVKDAQEFQGWLLAGGRADGVACTKARTANIINAAVSFYDFLKSSGRAAANPFRAIVRAKAARKIPENLLKEQEMQALLKELEEFMNERRNRDRVRKYRCHVMAEVMYATGMRVSELAGLKREDVDFENGLIALHDTKDGKARKAFLNEYAKRVLKLYVERIEPLIRYRWRKADTLFGACAIELKHLLNGELAKACAALGLKRITSHAFRHSFGFHLLRAGCSIRYIQDFLGHTRLKSTEVYTRVEKEDLRRVVDKYHPRAFARHSAAQTAKGQV
jgi:site-specific recombinase XerD